MRKLLWLGALAAVMFVSQESHVEGPWCAVLNFGGMGPSEVCSMPSFEVCRDLAMQYGSASFCRQNPGWPGYQPSGPKAGSPAHKKKHRRSS